MTVEQFGEILPGLCSKETSADPDGWTPENPTWGHCAVATMVAQDMFGGKIMRASLENTAFAKMRSHYFVRFDETKGDALVLDPTDAQFRPSLDPDDKSFFFQLYQHSESRTLEYLWSDERTRDRYKALMYRLAKHLAGDNIIFSDSRFWHCIRTALNSPCQKLKFGSVLLHNGEVVAEAANKPIPGLEDMCPSGNCIRMNIQS